MITVERTTDLDLIRGVFTHPDVWPHVSDDGSADSSQWGPTIGLGTMYVAILDDGEVAGCFSLTDCNGVTVELHTGVLPEFRGKRSEEAMRTLFRFIQTELPAVRRLRTWVSESNKPAMRFAIRVGFERCGVEPKSFLRYGELHDLHLFGVSFPCL